MVFQEALTSAPGKCILTGEHAVVYDAAAIVGAIELRAFAKIQLRPDLSFSIFLKDFNIHETLSPNDNLLSKIIPKNKQVLPLWQIITKIYNNYRLQNGLNIEIWSDIPIGVGLGSSAAVAVALTAAINHLFDLQLGLDAISQIAFEAEKLTHGTPSGIDNSIITYGGALLFKQQRIHRIEIPYSIPLLLINSGISRSTKVLVDRVKQSYTQHPSIIKHIFTAIDAISLKAENALRLTNLQMLGELLNYNHQLLRVLGVSTKELDSLVELSLQTGALGAKLTGAGGGGCIFALFSSDSVKKQCITSLFPQKIEYYDTHISEHGVILENLQK